MAPRDFDIKVLGEKELLKALDEFSASSQRRIARPAVRAASTPVMKAVRNNAPRKTEDRTGQLRKSIGRRMKSYKNSGMVIAFVGPRSRMEITDKHGRKVNPTKYAHLYEFGTAPHSVGGRFHPGAKPHPFVRDAWARTEGTAMQTMKAKIREQIPKEAARIRAKAAAKAAKR